MATRADEQIVSMEAAFVSSISCSSGLVALRGKCLAHWGFAGTGQPDLFEMRQSHVALDRQNFGRHISQTPTLPCEGVFDSGFLQRPAPLLLRTSFLSLHL